MSYLPVSYQWIDEPNQLESLVDSLHSATRLAVDTEFVRTNTYYSRPGLIQIAGPDQQVYLVDPTVFSSEQLRPLGDKLFQPQTQLLMHSAGEDLDIFLGLWDQLPANLFDTQIAASLVGYDRQMGLQRLLSEMLGVELSKEETRSDWLQRPLTEKQLHYAEADVKYLHEVADILQHKLEQAGRLQWFAEECDQQVQKYRRKTPDDQLYLGFGGGWKLKPQQQAALRHLAQWREQTARDRNIPKTFIAKDANLYALVEKQPRSKGQLAELGFQGSQIRRYGDQLLIQLAAGLESAIPEVRIPRPLSKGQQKDYKALREVVARRAEELDVPADLLASKAQLVSYLKARYAGDLEQDSPFAGGWRGAALQPWLDAFELPSNSSDAHNNNKDDEDE
ncbi:ribonuclease D [Ketobacter sp.]|uniref:ribonuclease D n=1 Tax=Ketobacter sp. TaxID=2083498 RepID=UPI000F150534|nr:ribonuclease D [Ketobacter sp.]RLT99302.1 MAG: ribonuclease D [Ketobacter sp.]